MKPRDPKVRELLAGEYVLETLHGRARERFERWLEEDRELQALVKAWHQRLPTLALAAPPAKPRPALWRALKQRIEAPKERSPGLWESLMFWRSLALTASTLAVALLLYIGLRPPAPSPITIVVLSDQSAKPAWLVSLHPGKLSIKTHRPQSIPPGKSFELWMLPKDKQAPRSLGLIPASGRLILRLTPSISQRLITAEGLAVSLEPKGGSSTGLPTGPVLYQGPVLSL